MGEICPFLYHRSEGVSTAKPSLLGLRFRAYFAIDEVFRLLYSNSLENPI
jgi:hypothetical protein